MGILGTIGTMLPTIGNILGQLLAGLNTKDSLGSSNVVYNFGDDITCGFKMSDTNEIRLLNSSFDDDKVITFAVPAIGDMEAETIVIPASGSAPVTEIFERCAAADSTTCMLSGSGADAVKLSSLGGASDEFHFAAGGRNIPVDGITSKRIGSFLKVTCDNNKAVFESARTIKEITSANFYGCNDSSVTLTNLTAVRKGTGTIVEVIFPAPFPDGTYLDVDVEVDMGDVAMIVAEQRIKIAKATPEELQTMRNAALALRR